MDDCWFDLVTIYNDGLCAQSDLDTSAHPMARLLASFPTKNAVMFSAQLRRPPRGSLTQGINLPWLGDMITSIKPDVTLKYISTVVNSATITEDNPIILFRSGRYGLTVQVLSCPYDTLEVEAVHVADKMLEALSLGVSVLGDHDALAREVTRAIKENHIDARRGAACR